MKAMSYSFTPGRSFKEMQRTTLWKSWAHLCSVNARVLFFVAACLCAAATPKAGAQDWSPLGPGLNNICRCFTIWNGQVVAGGQFTASGGDPVQGVATWDGAVWQPLGALGLNNTVWAITEFGGDLVAAGDFTTAGGTAALRIASWNGSTWTAFGAGFNGTVRSLAVLNNELYAGGTFTASGATTGITRIARWNSGTMLWEPLADGFNNTVHSLATYDGQLVAGQLVAGGSFTFSGLSGRNRVARWNGTAWLNLSTPGMSSDVYALMPYGDNLIAGGAFTTAGTGAGGTISALRVASWNGSDWSALGLGFNSWVYALTSFDGELVAGGEFSTTGSGGINLNRIAQWNGTSWRPMGAGMNDYVAALTELGDQLYAGGAFTAAGADLSARTAKWGGSACPSDLTGDGIVDVFDLFDLLAAWGSCP